MRERERERDFVCFLRRSSVFGTAKYFCGVGGTALRAKGSGFAHNPMTSLARGSFEKDTPNALSIPPSAVGVPEDCWPCSNARTSRKLERQRRPSATFPPDPLLAWLAFVSPRCLDPRRYSSSVRSSRSDFHRG